jgi:site-specific recombinase XerD
LDLLEDVHVKVQHDTAPRWLTRSEQLSLIREVRRKKSDRDRAIVETLLGTGLRISDPARLELSDLEINERFGWVRVRTGKASKARKVPFRK